MPKERICTAPLFLDTEWALSRRWNRSVKVECIRVLTPLSLEDARRMVAEYVRIYNEERLHSAIGYVTPKDMLEGRQAQILAERDRWLEDARQRRAARRQEARATAHDEPVAAAA